MLHRVGESRLQRGRWMTKVSHTCRKDGGRCCDAGSPIHLLRSKVPSYQTLNRLTSNPEQGAVSTVVTAQGWMEWELYPPTHVECSYRSAL